MRTRPLWYVAVARGFAPLVFMCYLLWYFDFVWLSLFVMVFLAIGTYLIIISVPVEWCLDMHKLHGERSIAAHDAYWKSPRGMFAHYILPPFLLLPVVLYFVVWIPEFLTLASTSPGDVPDLIRRGLSELATL